MCAISGSSNFDKSFVLYEKGLERGAHSSGILIISEKDSFIYKQPGFFEKELLLEIINDQFKEEKLIYFAFHSRAPTNTNKQDWDYENGHPFNFQNYYVSHNGIISNFNSFKGHQEFEVDSSIIPYHLYENEGNISKTYEQYTGLLTSWIYDSLEHKFILVKAGSSLHIDEDSFSSVPFDNSQPVEKDGLIYKLKDNKLQLDSEFNYNNPYFFL